ncbi:MAG: endonuclease/exonuclease/phosphatase family protein [Oceanipulchritudo sp.]
MRPLAAILLLALALHGVEGKPFRLASWNLQNYLSGNRFEEGSFRLEYPMPEKRKARIRQLLHQARPDILFLQEIGSAAHLKELQMDLAAGGLSYPYARFSASPEARSGLAFLSMIPPAEVLFHDPLPLDPHGAPGNVLPRGIQEVRFLIGGNPLRLFHVHLKSRYSADPADPESLRLRAAGLAALHHFLSLHLLADPSSAFALVGDLNTPFSSPLLRPLRAQWIPIASADADHAPWTYLHRASGSREVLDGFWIPIIRPSPLRPSLILPTRNPPSDHRLVLASLFLKKSLAPPSY